MVVATARVVGKELVSSEVDVRGVGGFAGLDYLWHEKFIFTARRETETEHIRKVLFDRMTF